MSLLSARFTRVFAGGLGPFLGIGLAIIVGSQALTSCGSDDDGTKCEPGVEQGCAAVGCPNNAGTQFCLASGSEFSPCECGSGSAGAAGAAGSGNAGNAGASGAGGASMTPTAERGLVGSPCETDGDCPGGLDCIPSTSTGPFQNGGPENGYCTATCTVNTDCTSLDALSACAIDFDNNTPDDASDDVSYCIALCQTGQPDQNEYKCGLIADQTRADLACFPATQTAGSRIGLCFPICQSDATCGNGRVCDLSTGACVDTAPTGAGIGEACVADAECAAGNCIQIRNSGFCTGYCTYGSIGGCGYEALNIPVGERGAACLDPASSTGGFGDVGFCTQLCDEAGDCAQPDWTCTDLTTFGDPTLPQLLGRFGFCDPPQLADAGP